MDIYDLINDYLEHLEVEAGRSKKTVDNYRLYLERFVEIALEILNKDEMRPQDITKELLRKYRIKLNRYGSENGEEDLKVITQAYHLIALRGFLKYLARRDIKSLDPSLVELPHVIRKQVTFLHYDEVEDMLEQIDLSSESGLKGVCGFNDNRDVEKAIEEGDENARLALDMYVDRIDRYIAEYYLELGGEVDAIVFTAGVLENGAETRETIIEGLAPLGIKINREVNDAIASFKEITSGIITTEDSTVPVYVEPTNEEVMIIRDAYKLCK